ncbi:MAG: autotransporter-associated beta strand repeat-containing protein [Bacteroidaceae bacterium]|nr:autotransporter-associated beta strand repeat-containing protein [Bacteroidaceae bacterium]
MMKKTILTLVLVMAAALGFAQRFTDKLDRGLVAVPGSSGGNFVSWRVFGEEYYDVTYNLYCNGTLLQEGLKVSNYSHSSGTATSKYQVAAVVKGVEQEKCAEVTRWNNGVLTIPVQKITGRDGTDVTSNYTINDISLGDLDGDGVVEFIAKRPCSVASDVSQKNCFHVLDCYDHKGNRLWWIDLGPNMLAGADEQWDCVCYDWDMDGKAEVLLRIQDNAYIHYADGTTQLIGSASVDTRWNGVEYTSSGNEYLLYLEGATGKPYEIGPESHPLWMDYPLTRVSDDWWGTGIVGHRSTKHYWGAPFLDGRKASIFLGRGCYTKHKFTALDVDPITHQLTQRWYWECTNSSSPWYGNGYHNFAIGDVDWDGRDEIIFGSMVIDDNGLGLSTTSYGHGDAQHCSDFDPYRKYEEQFACLEEGRANYGCNYRNAVTSQIYVKHDAGGDDGRALMGNFTNDYPGSVGRSVSSNWISSVADKFITALNGDAFISWGDLNQRIYWDGDLLDEYFDSPGTEGYGAIYKPAGAGRWNFQDSKCNNWTKNNPGAIADIFGDWREELVMRKSDNTAILVYTTPISTKYRIPTLWHDHQYRNAMVWQSMGYNQPPHKSYFLGELEGITEAPPPYTMTGRTEVVNGGTISTTNEHLLVCETNDTKVTIQEGASPYMITFNVPSWVQGSAASNATTKATPITYDYFTCTVEGGALTGATRVVKQGDGILTLPKVDMTYTGETNIWAGTINFNGSAKNSPIWLNRFGELNANVTTAEFKSVKADYGSVIRPGGENSMGTITIDSTYYMGFGSRLMLDVYSDGMKSDQIKAATLRIEKKNWTYGPAYLMPVIEVVEHKADGAETLEPGRYLIAHTDSLIGSLASIKIEGITSHKAGLELDEKGDIYLVLGAVRGASEIVWTGQSSSIWDYANTENFYLASDGEQTPDMFVEGDIINFTDEAKSFTVTLQDGAELPADTLRFNNTKAYTLKGNGIITTGAYVKENTGTVTMAGDNTYTGGNYLRGGITKVSSLANSTQAYGNLGGVTTAANKFIIENGAELQTTGTVKMGSPIRVQGEEGGVINNTGLFTMEKAIQGTTLTKKGAGTFAMQGNLNASELVVAAGTFDYGTAYTKTTTLKGSGALTGLAFLTTPIVVEAGAKASLTTINRQTHTNKITGSGQITIYCATEKGSNYYATRTPLQLNLSGFEGTVVIGATYNESMSNGATGRVFTLDTNTGAPKATFNIPTDFIVLNSGKTYKIGQVTGAGTLGGFAAFKNGVSSSANTWQVGNDENFTFDGIVTASDNFTKIGEGKMTVKGVWDNTGATKVSGGELHINSGALIGKGALTVDKDAVLTGVTKSGTPLTNSSFTINGTIQPGSSATAVTGAIDFNGKNVTFGAQSKIIVGLRKSATTSPQNSYLTNMGTLKITAGATIAPFLYNNYEPTTDEAVADSFYVWTDAKTVNITGDLNFELPELAYCDWDTSRIAEGLLFVRFNKEKYDAYITGIGNIKADETVTVEVVSLNGVSVGSFTCPMGSVKSSFAKTTLPKSLYLLYIKSESGKKGTIKLMK